jgi:predicted metal-dependent peptidase
MTSATPKTPQAGINQQGMDNLKKAKSQLVVQKETAFYASLLLSSKIVLTNSVPTAAVDAKGTLYINTHFLAGLTVAQVKFVLIHELEHVMRLHPSRRGDRNPKKWNVAGDACINDQLNHDNIGEPIDGCVNMPGSRSKLTEQVYEELPDDQGGHGSDEDDDPLGHDVIFGDGTDDPSDPKAMTPSEVQQAEADIKVKIAQAAQAARMQGSMSADLERRVNEILETRTPWYDVLERFMQNHAKNDYSWRRPNRKHIANDTYLPSLNNSKAMGHVVIGIDTSGSISDEELKHFGGHINRIMELCTPEKVTVIYCDAQVNHVDEFSGDDLPITLVGYGGGGTDLTKIFDYVDTKCEEPDVAVIMTDGYTPWPDEEAAYPTVVLCTTETPVPFGAETVRYDARD